MVPVTKKDESTKTKQPVHLRSVLPAWTHMSDDSNHIVRAEEVALFQINIPPHWVKVIAMGLMTGWVACDWRGAIYPKEVWWRRILNQAY